MKCTFCAEEIRPDAVLCRFCGAVKENGEWVAPRSPPGAPARTHPRGRFTIRTAGVLFVASAAFELLSVTSSIPFFGELRGGAVAVIYHLAYVVLFLALGAGLLTGRPWGYRVVFVGTLLYTLDRLRYLLDRQALEAYLTRQIEPYREFLDLIEPELIAQMMDLLTVLFVACWWGFALYIYLRRAYFQPRAGGGAP